MSTKGVGNFLINSVFSSGNLIFYEKSVGRTATGDVFTVGTAAVKVGGTGQDVDLQFYGTGSISAIIDCGATSFTLTGINVVTNANITMGTASKLVIPYKVTGDTTYASIWLDESDYYIHFYDNNNEVKITGCINA